MATGSPKSGASTMKVLEVVTLMMELETPAGRLPGRRQRGVTSAYWLVANSFEIRHEIRVIAAR